MTVGPADLDGRAAPSAVAALLAGIDDGLHIGAQLCVVLRDAPVVDVAVGLARVGIAMRTDTIMMWASCTKPLTATAFAQVYEAGLVGLDDRVCAVVPELVRKDPEKRAVTFRHLLTHTSGARFGASSPYTFPQGTYEEILAGIIATPLAGGSAPGERAAYGDAGMFLLAEAVCRLDGRPFPQYVREMVFEPLGMVDCWLGLPSERYDAYGDRIGVMHVTTSGRAIALHEWDSAAGAAHVNPAGNGRGPMNQLALFYRAMLRGGELDGARILSAATVEAMRSRQRQGMLDRMAPYEPAKLDWGLGFYLDSKCYGGDAPYGYGALASARTFGHSGVLSSVSFADPDHDLVCSLVFNGITTPKAHRVRTDAVIEAIYEDLGLGSTHSSAHPRIGRLRHGPSVTPVVAPGAGARR